MMRIITGSAKGKKLRTLEGNATRPTSERIKGAIFSSIQFEIENRRVLDLFAGCGQMGLEALSRGAERAVFIDLSREAMEVIKENISTACMGEKSHCLVSDYRNYIRKASGRERFDLVFIDPPYAMECCEEAVNLLHRAGLLADGALVVTESGNELRTEEIDMDHFEQVRAARYGKMTCVTVLAYKAEGGGEQ